jgi:hypothetical protein
MPIGWEISGSLVFASVIPFFFLLFQAESAVKRKLSHLDREARHLPCQDEQREGQTKQLHPALGGGCFVLGFLAKAIVGVVGVEKRPKSAREGTS